MRRNKLIVWSLVLGVMLAGISPVYAQDPHQVIAPLGPINPGFGVNPAADYQAAFDLCANFGQNALSTQKFLYTILASALAKGVSENTRIKAAEAVSKLGPSAKDHPVLVAALVNMLRTRSVRQNAKEALSQIGFNHKLSTYARYVKLLRRFITTHKTGTPGVPSEAEINSLKALPEDLRVCFASKVLIHGDKGVYTAGNVLVSRVGISNEKLADIYTEALVQADRNAARMAAATITSTYAGTLPWRKAHLPYLVDIVKGSTKTRAAVRPKGNGMEVTLITRDDSVHGLGFRCLIARTIIDVEQAKGPYTKDALAYLAKSVRFDELAGRTKLLEVLKTYNQKVPTTLIEMMGTFKDIYTQRETRVLLYWLGCHDEHTQVIMADALRNPNTPYITRRGLCIAMGDMQSDKTEVVDALIYVLENESDKILRLEVIATFQFWCLRGAKISPENKQKIKAAMDRLADRSSGRMHVAAKYTARLLASRY